MNENDWMEEVASTILDEMHAESHLIFSKLVSFARSMGCTIKITDMPTTAALINDLIIISRGSYCWMCKALAHEISEAILVSDILPAYCCVAGDMHILRHEVSLLVEKHIERMITSFPENR